MTYRERREARADSLRGWAEKRQAAAVEQLNSQPEMRHDWAFITQPGHIPQRARMIAADERSFRSMEKAEGMASRAAGIESQLSESIYDDDPDALDRLRAKLAGLEAERERIKAHNREMRKAGACPCPADCDCRTLYPRVCSCVKHPLPSYHLTNLGGNVSRIRERIVRLERQAVRTAKAETAGGVAVEERGRYAVVTFAEKPTRDVLDALKAAGFRWAKGSWVGEAARLPETVKS